LALLLLSATTDLAFGQAAGTLQATARLDRKEIQLGQSAVVIIDFSGCNGRPEITPPQSQDCSITLAGRPIRSTALTGLMRKDGQSLPGQNLSESLQKLTEKLAKDPLLNPEFLGKLGDADSQKQLQAAMGNLGAGTPDDKALAFHVHVQRTGSIQIPPFTVAANGETTTTKPLELHVSPTRGQDNVRLALSFSDPRPLVGQEVHLYVDLLVRREQVNYLNQIYPHLPVSKVHVSLPPLDSGAMESVRPLGELLKEHAPAQGHHGYKVNHLPSEAVFDKEPAGAQTDPGWYRRRLEVPVRFTQTGKVALPSAGAAGEIWAGTPSSSRRTNGRWQPFAAVSEPLAFDVRDLPPNKPRDFSGNIGALTVAASASQTKMPAGTPFTLTVRLEGQGYLPRPGSLDLAARQEFTQSFRVLPNADRALSDTLREVTFTLRPLNANVKEVPPVAVGYFDTKTDEFKSANSAAIALEVTAGIDIATENPTQAATMLENDEPLTLLEDLAAAHDRGWITRNLIPAAALTVALGLVTTVLARGRLRRWRGSRSNRAAIQQGQQAVGEVRRQLCKQAQSVQDVRELLQKALRQRFQLPPGEITPLDASARLRQTGVDGTLADECAKILEECAVAEYAPGANGAPPSELAARADRLISQLQEVGQVRTLSA
jgi:hypothetical protein